MNFDLQSAVDSFILSCRLPALPDQQSEKFLASPELHEMAKLLSTATKEERLEVLNALAEAMTDFAPFGAGRCAIYFGAGVERGTDPAITTPAVIGQLRQQLWTVAEMIKSAGQVKPPENLTEIPNKTSEQLETMHSLQFVAQSAVSHLVRSDAMRKQLSEDAEFRQILESVQGYHYGADWVLGVLSIRSGELLALWPKDRKGFWISYKNVANNFHLFTLLQEAIGPLMGMDRSGKDEVYATARGELTATQKMSDQAMWDYHQYTACKGKSNPMLFVWGESSPEGIPKLDGHAILLATPVTMQRSWSGGFFSPQLRQSPPSVEILSTLTPDEVDIWLSRAMEVTGG